LAATLSVQGSYYLTDPDPHPAAWIVGLVGIVSGALLLVGFLTPLIGVLTGLCGAAIGFSWIPACTRTLFESFVAAVLALAILLAVVILGPGAFSLDARVFWRREIIIPPPCPTRQ